MSDHCLVERDGHVVTVTMNRPESRNAWSGEMLGGMADAWDMIDNALDAMGDSGVLRVATHRDGDHVVVEVCDTGPGLSPEVAERAFEAFFTTKDVGQGTGLGLDIARRIVVDRHGGEIVIHPEAGNTVFEVRIPITHAD